LATLRHEIIETEEFSAWIRQLRDMRAKARFIARADSIRLGNLGDVRPVGGTVSEIRIDVGPGYRIYFTIRRRTLVVLLAGGDKSTQRRDIDIARSIAARID
jgi:putative addiction module killer protein